MASERRSNKKGYKRSEDGNRKEPVRVKELRNKDTGRRNQYSADPEYRAKQKERSRKQYRKENPKKPSSLNKGLLAEPKEKEVVIRRIPTPRFMDVYTIIDAAKALGKTRITIKKWIDEGLIPEPIIKDISRGYDHYAYEEVRIIGRILLKHEKYYDYLYPSHEETINRIWQEIEGFRKNL